jgi:hypothetical protein
MAGDATGTSARVVEQHSDLRRLRDEKRVNADSHSDNEQGGEDARRRSEGQDGVGARRRDLDG